MSTRAAEAGVWQGAVWAWKNQERVSLGLTTSLPNSGSHPSPPLHLGSHGDSDRRIGQCLPPRNSGRRHGQHRGLSGKGLPAGTAHPPSLAGTCGKRCVVRTIQSMAIPNRQHKTQSSNTGAKETVKHPLSLSVFFKIGLHYTLLASLGLTEIYLSLPLPLDHLV